MSFIQQSPLHPAAGLTLADIGACLRGDPDLPKRAREEMLSALNTAAAVLERDPAEIPADPLLLRRRLAEASPVKRGITLSTWKNVRSLAGKAVGRIVPTQPGRRTNTLDPAWQALADASKRHFKQRVRTSGLMHFCSARGIPPEAVDQPTFEAFRQDLAQTLRKDPAEAYRGTVVAWNKAVDTIPGWPGFKAVRPSRRKTWTFSWSELPLLRPGRDVWLQQLANRDLVDAPELKSSTIKSKDTMLRESASALALQGWDPASFCEIRHFGTLDAFKAVVRGMTKQRGGLPGGHIVQVAWMLKSIATHMTKVPEDQLEEMKEIIRRLEKKTRQTGMTVTNDDRLMPFEDPATVKRFLEAPERMLADAGKTKIRQKAARLMAMALAYELLVMTLMRIGNLVDIDIDRHIVRVGGLVWLKIPGSEVKNGKPLKFPLPASTVALLDTYLRDHRHHLVTIPTTALFPGRKNEFRDRSNFGAKLKKMVKTYTDLTVHPHLFRHIGAKLYLEHHPGAYEVVRRLLGHSSLEVTTKTYTGTETVAAIRQYQASILRRRCAGGVA
nr:site-specific integrase [uncultured Rhodopila sp.]